MTTNPVLEPAAPMADTPVTAPRSPHLAATPVTPTPGSTAVVPALSYHRLPHLGTASARWWRPLLVGALAPVLTLAGFVVILVATTLLVLLPQVPTPTENFDDPRNPVDLALSLGLLAVMLPAVVLAWRWAGARRRGLATGALHSVAGRFRWGMTARAAIVVMPLVGGINIALSLVFRAPDFSVPQAGVSLVAVYLVVVALTPLQCAAEEYVFRGLPMQALGTWLRSPLWGIVLPAPLFMAGHGYDWFGQVEIAVFALCMGYLTWKTGGLELAVLFHTANNLSLFLVAPFSPSSLQQGETDPVMLLFSLPMIVGLTLGSAWWVSRREGVGFFEPVRGRGRVALAT